MSIVVRYSFSCFQKRKCPCILIIIIIYLNQFQHKEEKSQMLSQLYSNNVTVKRANMFILFTYLYIICAVCIALTLIKNSTCNTAHLVHFNHMNMCIHVPRNLLIRNSSNIGQQQTNKQIATIQLILFPDKQKTTIYIILTCSW